MRACRHSLSIARVCVLKIIRLYGWRHIKCRKAAVLRQSYFSSEAFCFHHCGLSAEASNQPCFKTPTKKTEPQSLSPVSGFLIGKQCQWNMKAPDKVVIYIWQTGLQGTYLFIYLFFVPLFNRKSILNSLPHFFFFFYLWHSPSSPCWWEALKSYLIIKHEKLWTISYYQVR